MEVVFVWCGTISLLVVEEKSSELVTIGRGIVEVKDKIGLLSLWLVWPPSFTTTGFFPALFFVGGSSSDSD